MSVERRWILSENPETIVELSGIGAVAGRAAVHALLGKGAEAGAAVALALGIRAALVGGVSGVVVVGALAAAVAALARAAVFAFAADAVARAVLLVALAVVGAERHAFRAGTACRRGRIGSGGPIAGGVGSAIRCRQVAVGAAIG